MEVALGCVLQIEARPRRQDSVGPSQRQAAAGHQPQAAPGPVTGLEHFRQQLSRLGIALGANHGAIGVLHPCHAGLELAHAGQHAGHQLQRLEAAHHHRHPPAGHQLLQLGGAQHTADMPGRQEPLHPVAGFGQDRRHRWAHPHMGIQQRQVGDPQRQGLARQQCRGRGRGLEAHRQKHHLALGVPAGQRQGLQRFGEQPHVAAGGPHRQQRLGTFSRHPQHVAIGAENQLRPQRQPQRLLDRGSGRDAHRAAGPVDQSQPLRQQLIEAPAHDRVGLPAADLHQRPGAACDRCQLGRHRPDGGGGAAPIGRRGCPARARRIQAVPGSARVGCHCAADHCAAHHGPPACIASSGRKVCRLRR